MGLCSSRASKQGERKKCNEPFNTLEYSDLPQGPMQMLTAQIGNIYEEGEWWGLWPL